MSLGEFTGHIPPNGDLIFKKFATLNTGHKIPLTGYGTWQAPPGEVGAGVYEALKVGYRHLDLAKIYENQVEVGQGIKRALADIPGLKREDIFITSKLWCNSFRPENVPKALHETLAELDLEYLDLYLIHWPVAFAPGTALYPTSPDGSIALDKTITLSDTWRALTKLPKSLVRSVGVSNFSIEFLTAIIRDTGIVPAVNQIERHPRLPNHPLVNYCRDHKIHITAYSAFGNNALGQPLLVQHPRVKAVAERLNVTPAQVITAWSRIGDRSVIPKSVTPSRIAENFVEIELDDEAVAELAKMEEEPQRFNIPANYSPRWNINIFNTQVEQGNTSVVLSLE